MFHQFKLNADVKGWTIRKVMGEGGDREVPKKIFPRTLLIKHIYSYGFWPQKIYPQGGSVQVRLLQINYEVNDKSKMEIKRDFFLIST